MFPLQNHPHAEVVWNGSQPGACSLQSEAPFSLVLWLRYEHSPGRTAVCFWILQKGELGTPIKEVIPRRAGRKTNDPDKGSFISIGGWQLAGSVYKVREEPFDGSVICGLQREMKGAHLHLAICRFSSSCCTSWLPQGEGDIGIKAEEVCSD